MVLSRSSSAYVAGGPCTREASVWEPCCWYSGVINMAWAVSAPLPPPAAHGGAAVIVIAHPETAPGDSRGARSSTGWVVGWVLRAGGWPHHQPVVHDLGQQRRRERCEQPARAHTQGQQLHARAQTRSMVPAFPGDCTVEGSGRRCLATVRAVLKSSEQVSRTESHPEADQHEACEGTTKGMRCEGTTKGMR